MTSREKIEHLEDLDIRFYLGVLVCNHWAARDSGDRCGCCFACGEEVAVPRLSLVELSEKKHMVVMCRMCGLLWERMQDTQHDEKVAWTFGSRYKVYLRDAAPQL